MRQGLDGLSDLVREIVNEAMKIERENYLGVRPYERSEARQGHANGCKPKTVKTRVGELTFDIPQAREKGLCRERALLPALAEMYVQGVSTRKGAAVTERLYGTPVSANQVSRAAKQLDEELEAWRNRRLGEIVYLYLDARYEKVRQAGIVQDAAILMACGVKKDGKRSILGISLSLSEAGAHRRAFLEGLVKRGLHGVQLIISDDPLGLEAARKAVFSGVPWQRCQFHLPQNAQAYVPRSENASTAFADFQPVGAAQPGDQMRNKNGESISKRAVLPQADLVHPNGSWRRLGIWSMVFADGFRMEWIRRNERICDQFYRKDVA